MLLTPRRQGALRNTGAGEKCRLVGAHAGVYSPTVDPVREILVPMGAPGVTVFCLDAEVPTLEELFAWVRGDGVELFLDLHPDAYPIDPRGREWDDVLLRYRPDRLPIPVGCASFPRRPGSGAVAGAGEAVDWMSGRVRSLPHSDGRGAILERLRQTQMVATARMPYPPVGADAEAAIWSIADFFVREREGLAHVDWIGFYDGDDLILDTRTPREKREQLKRLGPGL